MMKRSRLFLFGLFTATLVAFFSVQDNSGSTKKIIRRKEASIYKFPHLATIVTRSLRIWWYLCGGSIINDRWIVTASHCLYHFGKLIEAEYTKVGVGMDEIDGMAKIALKPYWSDDFKDVEAIVTHSKFPSKQMDTIDLRGDIGLIKLKEKLTFSNKIKPVRIHKYHGEGLTMKTGTPIYLIGYGSSNSELNVIKGKIISQLECLTKEFEVPNYIDESVLCAKFSGDACYGDSGGGIVEKLSPSKYLLIGVVTVSSCVAGINYATRVANYTDWIEAYMDGGTNMYNNDLI